MHVHCKVPYNYVPVPSDLFFANYETLPLPLNVFFFFFNDTATTEIYTLSLHDALPISRTGTGGRIEITGPVLFSGYRLRPDLTRQVMASGWLVTPDVGAVATGRLAVRGRAGEVINTGGGKGAPAEAAAGPEPCPGGRGG